jgi:hypothetical protein
MEDIISFEDLTPEEIEATIVKYVKEIRKLEAEKKDFVGGCTEAIKELNSRINLALETLDRKKKA